MNNPVFSEFVTYVSEFSEVTKIHLEKKKVQLHNPTLREIIRRLDGRSIENTLNFLGRDAQLSEIYFWLQQLEDSEILIDLDKRIGNEDEIVLANKWNGQEIFLVKPNRNAFFAKDLRWELVTDYHKITNIKDRSHTSKPIGLFKPFGLKIRIGPIFDQSGPCLDCLSRQLARNDPRVMKTKVGEKVLFTSHTNGFKFKWGEKIIQNLCLAFSANLSVFDQASSFWEVNLMNSSISQHRVVKLPDCLKCGEKNLTSKTTEPLLEIYDHAHDLRDKSDASLRKYSHLVDPLTGFISHFIEEKIENTDTFICIAGSKFGDEGIYTTSSVRCSGVGSGFLASDAKRSALFEALERLCNSQVPLKKKTMYASFEEISSQCIDPRDVMLVGYDQQWEHKFSKGPEYIYCSTPNEFDVTRRRNWVVVNSLVTGDEKLVPLSILCLPSRNFTPESDCIVDSTGCAAGNSLSQACLHALYECVERDNVAIWWYNMINRPYVNLNNLGNESLNRIVEYIEDHERDVKIFHISSDSLIPTFVAISSKKSTQDRMLLGFGTNLNPLKAIEKAIMELSQSIWSGIKYDNSMSKPISHFEIDLFSWWEQIASYKYNFLTKKKEISLFEMECYSSGSSAFDLKFAVECLQNVGIHPYFIDLTLKEIGLPVAKIVAPGLRSLLPRFGKGRLFSVPVRLGWLKTEKSKTQLNPNQLFV